MKKSPSTAVSKKRQRNPEEQQLQQQTNDDSDWANLAKVRAEDDSDSDDDYMRAEFDDDEFGTAVAMSDDDDDEHGNNNKNNKNNSGHYDDDGGGGDEQNFLEAKFGDDDDDASVEEDAFVDAFSDDGDDESDDVYVSDDDELLGDELRQVLDREDHLEGLSDGDDDDDDSDSDDGDDVRVLERYEAIQEPADAATTAAAGNSDVGESRNAWLEKRKKKSKKERAENPSLFDDVDDDDDSSEDEGMVNTVGNVPMEWYEEYEHIGYDKDGKKIARKKRKDALDHFIARHDDPNYLRTVYDEVNDREHVISGEDLQNIIRIAKNGMLPLGTDPYRPYVDWLKYDSRFPLVGNERSKRSFLPNRDELRIVARIAERIRKGWIKPLHVIKKEKEERERREEERYLMWGADGALLDQSTKVKRSAIIAPPKIEMPGHEESYNPPPEYVTEKNQHRVFSSLRHVPQYENYVQELFERCLDLYLSPRVEIKQVHVPEPKKLLPELPKPEELRPFPEIFSLDYHGHTDIVRTISVDPTGRWLVSGSNDHTVRLWEIDTGRCTRIWVFKGEIRWVEWNPNPKLNLIAVAVQNYVYLIQPPESGNEESNRVTANLFPTTAYSGEGEDGEDFEKEALFMEVDEQGQEMAPTDVPAATDSKNASDTQSTYTVASESKKGRNLTLLKWSFFRKETEKGFRKQGILVCLTHLHDVTQVTWHFRGDYFCTLAPGGYSSGIIMHQMSRRESQRPFRQKVQSKGETFVKVAFHPKKPLFFVVTKTMVKAYDLIRQKLYKRLKNHRCRYISTFDIHPTGGHVLIGGYDKRIEWFDMELTSRPFRTLRFHDKAVRTVTFHRRYPLFSTCSDDGTVHIFHNTVYDDWLKDPMIVPVKILRGHRITDHLGVLNVAFHPVQPWIFSCGADRTIRLYTC